MVSLKEKEPPISDSEWEVMRIVWTLKKADSKTIIAQLQAKMAWSDSTIKTLLRRLVAKDCLSTKKAGRRFVYQTRVSQVEVMVKAAQELLSRMCDMHKGQVIMELLKQSPISQNDLERISQIINQKEQTAPKSVPCNCLAKVKKEKKEEKGETR